MTTKKCTCAAHGPMDCSCGAWDDYCDVPEHKELQAQLDAMIDDNANMLTMLVNYIAATAWEKAEREKEEQVTE